MASPGRPGFQQPYDAHRPMSPSAAHLLPPVPSRLSHSPSDESAVSNSARYFTRFAPLFDLRDQWLTSC